MRWLDCSAYTGELAPSFIDAARANGVEGLAVQLYGGTPSGTGLNPRRLQQLNIARNAGLRIAGYAWPPSTTIYGAQMTPGYAFEFLGLDVEAGAAMTRSQVNEVKALGFRPVKYASLWTWKEIMGNTTAFADVPTWLAYYYQQGWKTWDSVSGLALPDGSRTVIVQVQGTTTLLDDQYDLNVADRSFFTEMEEFLMALSDAEQKTLAEQVTRVAAFIDGLNTASIDQGHMNPDGTPRLLTPFELILWHTSAFDRDRFSWLMGLGNQAPVEAFKQLVREAVGNVTGSDPDAIATAVADKIAARLTS